MKFLIDTARVGTGGSLQNSLAMLDNATRHPGHEWVGVLSPSVSAEFPAEKDAGLSRVERLGVSGSLLSRTREVRAVLPRVEAETRPDCVYTAFNPALWHAKAPHLLGFAWSHVLYPESPFVRSVRSLSRGLLGARIRAKEFSQLRELRRFGHIVVETETVARRLREVTHIEQAEIYVVRNSYSPAFAAAVEAGGEAPPEDRKVILVPSDYRPNKNQEIVPAVAERLKHSFDGPFEMVLTIPFDKNWERIEADAEGRGVKALVKNMGPVPHAKFANAYTGAHVVYLPTLLECSTAVYPESFMAKRPLVTSKLDFAEELCAEGALYCDPYSAEEAARQIQRLLEDQALYLDTVSAGQAVLARNYPTPEAKWLALVDVLERVAGAGGAA